MFIYDQHQNDMKKEGFGYFKTDALLFKIYFWRQTFKININL